MTDPIEKQRPLLVWHTDHDAVYEARELLLTAGLLCSSIVPGQHYSTFTAYLDAAIDPVLDAKLRALVSRVQVSLSRS